MRDLSPSVKQYQNEREPLPENTILKGKNLYSIYKCIGAGGFSLIYKAGIVEDGVPESERKSVIIKEFFPSVDLSQRYIFKRADNNIEIRVFDSLQQKNLEESDEQAIYEKKVATTIASREAQMLDALVTRVSTKVAYQYLLKVKEDGIDGFISVDNQEFSNGNIWYTVFEDDTLETFDYKSLQDVNTALQEAKSILSAIEALHNCDSKVLHLDLKTSNLMKWKKDIWMPIDFGSAVSLRENNIKKRELSSTLGYCAPELRQLLLSDAEDDAIVDEGLLGCYTDVYSIGIILLELLAKAPFANNPLVDFQGFCSTICDKKLSKRENPPQNGILDCKIFEHTRQHIINQCGESDGQVIIQMLNEFFKRALWGRTKAHNNNLHGREIVRFANCKEMSKQLDDIIAEYSVLLQKMTPSKGKCREKKEALRAGDSIFKEPTEKDEWYLKTQAFYNSYAGVNSPILKGIHADPDDSLKQKLRFGETEEKTLEAIISETLQNSVLWLVGKHGAGKTHAMLSGWKELQEKKFCSIFVRLNTLKNTETLRTHICNTVFGGKEDECNRFYEHWSSHKLRPLILLLDGFNELSDNQREALNREVKQLAENLNVIVVVSTTCADSEAIINPSQTIELSPLEEKDIDVYLKKKTSLGIPQEPELKELLKTPLLLLLYADLAQSNATNDYCTLSEQERRLRKLLTNITPSRHLFLDTQAKQQEQFGNQIESAATLIARFFSSKVQKIFNNSAKALDIKILNYVAITFVLPYLCYEMQKSNETVSRFRIGSIDFSKSIKNAIIMYLSILDEYENSGELKKVFYTSGQIDINKQVEEIISILLVQLNVFHTEMINEDTFYVLSHQEYRDVLAALHLINQLQVAKNGVPECFKNDSFAQKRGLLHHFNQLGEMQLIDSLWETLRNKSAAKCGSACKNVLCMYQTAGIDFAELSFAGIDLCQTSLDDFGFRDFGNISMLNGATLGEKTFALTGHADSIGSLAAVGNTLASRGADTTRTWNIGTFECMHILLRESEYRHFVEDISVDILPFNESIVAYQDGSTVVELDTATGEQRRYQGAGADIRLSHIKYSFDGEQLLGFSEESGKIVLWRRIKTQLYKPHATISELGKTTPCIGSSIIAYCTKEGEVRTYNTSSKEYKDQPIKLAKQEYVCGLAINEEQDRLIVCVYNDEERSSIIQQHKLSSGEKSNFELTCEGVVRQAKLSRDGRALGAITSKGEFHLYSFGDCPDDKPTECNCKSIYAATSFAFKEHIAHIAPSAEQYRKEDYAQPLTVFVGYADGYIEAYEVFSAAQQSNTMHLGGLFVVGAYSGRKPIVNAVTIGNNNSVIAAYADGRIREWDLLKDVPTHVYSKKLSAAHCIECNSNKTMFASGHADGTIALWNATSKVFVAELRDQDHRAHKDTVRDLKFTDDGRLLSCSNDKTIKIWDVGMVSQQPVVLQEHTDYVKCLLYYNKNNKQRLISGSSDKSILIWNLDEKNIGEPIRINKHVARVRSMALNADKGTFVSSAEDLLIFEWNVLDGTSTGRSINGADLSKWYSVEAVAYAPDGEGVLIASYVWDANGEGLETVLLQCALTNQETLREWDKCPGLATSIVCDERSKTCLMGLDNGTLAVAQIVQPSAEVRLLKTKKDFFKADAPRSITFSPEWIGSYYMDFAPIKDPIELKNAEDLFDLDHLLSPSEQATKKRILLALNNFQSCLERGVLSNPFYCLEFNLSHDMSEKLAEYIIDLLLKHTQGTLSADRISVAKERAFLLPNILYLFDATPYDEQNALMLTELFTARFEESNIQAADQTSQSLDKLIEIERSKNPEARAVVYYDNFLREKGKKAIVKSCLQRFFVLGGFYKNVRKQMSISTLSEKQIHCMAESVIDNEDEYNPHRNYVRKEQINLLKILITHEAVNPEWEKENILASCFSVAKAYLTGSSNGCCEAALTYLASLDSPLRAAKTLYSLMHTLNFWALDIDEYKEKFQNCIEQLERAINNTQTKRKKAIACGCMLFLAVSTAIIILCSVLGRDVKQEVFWIKPFQKGFWTLDNLYLVYIKAWTDPYLYLNGWSVFFYVLITLILTVYIISKITLAIQQRELTTAGENISDSDAEKH